MQIIATSEKPSRYKNGSISLIKSLTIALAIFTANVAVAYETAPTLSAKAILKPELLKGEHHTVREQVRNDGLFNHYTVDSELGTFKAGSTTNLRILLNEINAIADMKKVETDDTVVAALKQSGENTVTGIKNLVNDPQGTLSGAASGVSSLFNRAKETVGKREEADVEDSKLEQVVGISKSKGKIASKYGVNVYSRNELLQEELDRLGRADFFGGLGVGVATSFVPGVGGVVLSTTGAARLLNEAINTTPAAELWRQNKNKLLAMGVDEDTVKLFLNNPHFSPALSTVLVTAMESLKGVEKRDLLIKVALQAADPVMAETIVKTGVMTAGYHETVSPLQRLAPMARLTQGVRKDGTRVLVLPVDYITWSQRVAEATSMVGGKAEKDSLEIWVLGSLSEKAREEFKKRGWKVHTDTGSKLIAARE